MKLRTLISALIFSSLTSSAQQGIVSNLYEYHSMLFNPALTAADGKSRISTLGIANTSFSLGTSNRFALTYEQPFKKLHGALGAYLLNNQERGSRNIAAGLSYAYQVQLSPKLKLAAGIQAGTYSARQDYTWLRPLDLNDPAIPYGNPWSNRLLNPDLNAGLSLHYKRSYIAFGSRHITQPVLDFSPSSSFRILEKLNRENYLQMGTVLGEESEKVNIMLSSLTYFTDGTSKTLLNMSAWINKKYMLGASIPLYDNGLNSSPLMLNMGLEFKKLRFLLSYQPHSIRLARGGYLTIGLAYRF